MILTIHNPYTRVTWNEKVEGSWPQAESRRVFLTARGMNVVSIKDETVNI